MGWLGDLTSSPEAALIDSLLEVVTSLELSDKARDNTKLDLVLNN